MRKRAILATIITLIAAAAIYGVIIWINGSHPGGSSPIIVSDGSTHVKHAGGMLLTYAGSTSAILEQANYRPVSIGSGCTVKGGIITCPHPIDVSKAASWTLWVCENQGPPCNPKDAAVQIGWNAGDAAASANILIGAEDNQNLVLDSTPSGWDLHHSSGPNSHLQSAFLTVTPAGNPAIGTPAGQPVTFGFSCPADPSQRLPSYPVCLTIDYKCPGGTIPCGN